MLVDLGVALGQTVLCHIIVICSAPLTQVSASAGIQ